MNGNRVTARGDGNLQTIGDGNFIGNTVIVQPVQASLTHSFIHDLLDVVYSLPESPDDTYSLQTPAPMHDKLKFNNAHRYLRIIDNHAEDYARVDEVMKDYANSEDIVKKLRDMFLAVAVIDVEDNPCVGDGDAQLDQIKEQLATIITSDAQFDATAHPLEKIEQFCIALIAYGVSKCKILETPVRNALA